MTQVTADQKETKKKLIFPFSFLGKLVRNSVFLVLLVCLLMCFLYLIGNFQAFSDKTQLRILFVLSITAAALVIMSFLGFVLEIVFLFMKNRKAVSLFSILFFIFSILMGCGFIAFSTIIRRLAVGI